ncbi:MAG: DNRLRE domain-containing protein, partial [Gammaproteobacteria bacterium]|nr:DNRLRE domain-containing protein [Gammaproteobacteria bacterium]
NAIIIKWDLSAIPTTATITDATLQLYMDSMEDGGGDSIYDIAAHKITGVNPDPATCTWNTPWTSPGGQSDIALPEDTNSMDKTLGYKSWSVTDMVQDWVSSPGENYGMLLNSDTSASIDSNRFFSSSDSTNQNQRPKLIITYSGSGSTHRADTNPQNGCVDTQEILAFISQWHYDSTGYPMREMMEGVTLWKAGTGCS